MLEISSPEAGAEAADPLRNIAEACSRAPNPLTTSRLTYCTSSYCTAQQIINERTRWSVHIIPNARLPHAAPPEMLYSLARESHHATRLRIPELALSPVPYGSARASSRWSVRKLDTSTHTPLERQSLDGRKTIFSTTGASLLSKVPIHGPQVP